jgi:hypothetical protein
MKAKDIVPLFLIIPDPLGRKTSVEHSSLQMPSLNSERLSS